MRMELTLCHTRVGNSWTFFLLFLLLDTLLILISLGFFFLSLSLSLRMLKNQHLFFVCVCVGRTCQWSE